MRKLARITLATVFLAMCGRSAHALTVEEAVHRARTQNGEVKAAMAQADSKVGDVWKERSEFWFRTQGGYTHQDEPSSGENHRIYNNRLQFTVDQPLYTFGRLTHNLRKAKYKMAAAKSDVGIKQLDVQFDAAKAYYNVLLKAKTETVRKDNVGRSQKTLRDTRALQSEGKVTDLKVKEAELQANRDVKDLETAVEALAVARQKLNLLMGEPLDAEFELTDVLYHDPVSIDGLLPGIKSAIGANPQLKKNASQKKAAQAGRRAALGSHFPLIYFELVWSYNDQQNQKDDNQQADPAAGAGGGGGDAAAGSFAGEYNSWYFSLLAHWPLMKRGIEAHGKYEEAKALIRKAQYGRKHIENSLRVQAREALAEIAEADRNARVAQQKVETSKLRVRNVKLKAEEGKASAREVTDEERSLDEDRLEHFRAIFQHRVAIAKIEKVTGRSIYSLEPIRAAASGK